MTLITIYTRLSTICKATAFQLITVNSWYYLSCMECNRQVAGSDADIWCTMCEMKIEEPIPRFRIRLRVEDTTGRAIFEPSDYQEYGIEAVEHALLTIFRTPINYQVTRRIT
ncbi:hypothetical protein MKX03_027587 [Papaver bracteatum]|nr:hypothetical protein MKX03_027587 [Papaver bracteatum]